MNPLDNITEKGLYQPSFEHDNCGWGLITQMDGEPSHWLVSTAITALTRLTHRGGIAADGKSGDGCGLLIKKPEKFLRIQAEELGFQLNQTFAVSNIFLSKNNQLAQKSRDVLQQHLSARGLILCGWREVPVDTSVCGDYSLSIMPKIEQAFITAPSAMDEAEFDRHLFVARRQTEISLRGQDPDFYISTMSSQVLLYKGLTIPADLARFYKDLENPELATSIAIFHQRFSTNTLPQWRLAQPFRMLAHNGEINTIQGNRIWAKARASKFRSPLLPELAELQPLVNMSGSDSMSLDNMLEILTLGGMDIFQATKLLVPPAWHNLDYLDPDLRAFLEYNSVFMEPWDGPAGLVMTDGRYACCAMDRNGLRPARYVIDQNHVMTLASEIGVWDYDPGQVVKKGRLKPGEMMAVDTMSGELLLPDSINDELKSRKPFARWMQKHVRHLRSRLRESEHTTQPFNDETLSTYQKQFGVSFEERDEVLRVLASDGQEAIGSMGDDTPFPVLSQRVRSLYDNFRQQFAQVTNPPIDPLREAIVMSLETCLGAEGNVFAQSEVSAKRLLVRSPILSRAKFETLMAMEDEVAYRHKIIDLNYDPEQISLSDFITQICHDCENAVKQGNPVIVLSDRALAKDKVPAHALLATGAVHHYLISVGLRSDANIIVETGTARDSHHCAVLIGYGATCLFPYLAYESIQGLVRDGSLEEDETLAYEQLYRKGINKGLMKILSKMGIATVDSYRAAQLFEIVGLHQEVVDRCFKGTTARIQGANFEDLQQDQKDQAKKAWRKRINTDQGGLLKYTHGGEYHSYNPDVVKTLQDAVTSGQWQDYKTYADLVDNRPAATLRDLLKLPSDRPSIPLDEVEPVGNILKRFDSAGMSLGALSPEAHETLAEAMNRLGARSNSGEGGEDEARYGTLKMSKIKQIASGRFGVTPHYLVNAEVLQIKVAQGAKPGEGGQLPGHKVNKLIARLRHSVPGVALISPPPHHDIYSIEDLAQLIYDLKQVNPNALVSVKLVAEAGVGTIAAGVAKAYADLITVSGYDGGTGASPLTSVKYAGSPWELGLSETQQVLRANNLRDKIRLQADGGMKTGLDVIKASMLGAESFGFGTGPMIAMGCKFLRICHLNNCATGVATQHKVLRFKHFNGDVEKVMNYMRFIAEDVRRHLAELGMKSLSELIGRADLLDVIEGQTERQKRLDLKPLLYTGEDPDAPRYCLSEKNAPWDKGELAEKMVKDCMPAIQTKLGGSYNYKVKNTDRSIGARLSGEIARLHGDKGMTDAPIELYLKGTAGQSFGVWNAGGLHLHLEGDANDYVGKGMAGGKIMINPPSNSRFKSHESTIMGNTCLYGATGGLLYAAGRCGERFAVRNSGATAVVEGVGDHACEYMTGGAVVCLGRTGVNFGAGMTGGLAFVLDIDRSFVDRYNHELVDIQRIRSESTEAYRNYLQTLLEDYAKETGSEWGREVYENFYRYASYFWLLKPKAMELNQLFATLHKAA